MQIASQVAVSDFELAISGLRCVFYSDLSETLAAQNPKKIKIQEPHTTNFGPSRLVHPEKLAVKSKI